MKALALDEGSLDRHASRRDLPLRLGRQPTLRPPRKRIRLVVAHVTHGLIERHRTSARKRELRKAIAGALPIEWRFPSTVVHHREPGREPELRALVAAVVDEVEILAIRDEPGCEPEVLEKFAVRRQLVVEREALVLMSDAMHAAAERLPRRFGEHALGQLRALAIDGAKRIHPEDVLDVRDEQLLMLLLVMESEHDERIRRMILILVDLAEERAHRFIDMSAILEDFAHRRSRHEPAHRATVALAGLHVVGIEEKRVPRIRRYVLGRVRTEDERLEEPARVREMPLGGAHVGHAADDVVLGVERLAEPFGLRTNGIETLGERLRARV